MMHDQRHALHSCAIWLLLAGMTTFSFSAHASLSDELNHLKNAYPEHIKSVTTDSIIWTDGTIMPVDDKQQSRSQQDKLNSPTLADQLEQDPYLPGKLTDNEQYPPRTDPGRIRYEPFFTKMYGQSANSVKSKLTTVYWMPLVFGHQFPIQVTTVNEVDKKITLVSNDLQEMLKLHPELKHYLENPAGFFNWRRIANTNRLSAHSYGIAFDLNIKDTNYWQWELQKHGLPVSESTPVTYINRIPWEIIVIFEKYGFIWGGKWEHFDTMHFEYRPEMIH